jgi:pimeloyl-ACP methyl ester carboxylesterase
MRLPLALGALLLVVGCASATESGVSVGPIDVTSVSTKTSPITLPPSNTSRTTTGGTPTPSSGPTTPPATGVSAVPVPAPFVWKKCGQRIECSTLEVPLDYANAGNGEVIKLNVKRRTASGSSLGPLLVNPGGPGVGGSVMVDQAQGYFDPKLLERFDLVAWDPRGTGESEGMNCLDDTDLYLALDPTPDDAAEREALAAADKLFADGCKRNNARTIPYIGTESSARDIDQIRVALGVEKITFLGFSYGSQLGATYATLFPNSLRTMVIDGASDPTATGEVSNLQQIVGFENAFNAFLDQCAKNPKCAFYNGGDPGTAFEKLMVQLDKNPLTVSAKRAKVNQGVAINAVAEVLYVEGRWPALATALADAEKGKGAGLLGLFDSFTRRNSPGESHLFDAFITITCIDNPGPSDPAAIDAFIAKATNVAPRLGKYLTSPSNVCPLLSTKKPLFKITGIGAGKILVVGTTGDPATPYDSTVTMAKTLENGVLLTVVANQHTGYSANQCATDVVDSVLIDLKFPEPEKVCS